MVLDVRLTCVFADFKHLDEFNHHAAQVTVRGDKFIPILLRTRGNVVGEPGLNPVQPFVLAFRMNQHEIRLELTNLADNSMAHLQRWLEPAVGEIPRLVGCSNDRSRGSRFHST